MATWDQVRSYVRDQHPLQRVEEHWFDVMWRFGDGGDAAGEQGVSVQVMRAFDRPWLLVRATVCGEALLSPAEALTHNATLALGALALEGKRYVLRYATCLDTLAWPALDRALDYVAREAARLRRRAYSVEAPARAALTWAAM